MGGDHAPDAVVQAVNSLVGEYPQVVFHVTGPEHLKHLFSDENVVFHIAEQVIAMDADAMLAVKSGARSTLGRGMALLKSGTVDAFVSAGNTAALMALGYMGLRDKQGKRRPCIMSNIVTQGKKVWILDLGANIQSTEVDLYENAKAALDYLGDSDLSVRLLNIGSEPDKGPPVIQKAHELLEKDPLINYMGFVEGHEVLVGKSDIIVCNGFEGNAMTKLLESVTALWGKDTVNKPVIAPYAVFLGISKPVYKLHGRLQSEGISSGLRAILEHSKISTSC